MLKTNKHKKQFKTAALILLLSAAFVITIFSSIIVTSKAAVDGWTLVYDARNLKAYPNLREYVWQKNAIMSPNGQYDKIGLHRLVNTGTTIKGVVLMLPGTYLSGEGWTSNPPTDNFTKTENDSQAMYWANLGFDVYALDYRTHFVPTNLNSSQLGFMANWGYDQWISDIKEAVNKVKEVSGASKIFIAGFSFGGRVAMYYSAEYWQQDIKGIILLDGGTNIKTANPTNTYNLTALLKQENDTSKWALETPNLPGTAAASGWLFQKQYAAQNPGAPAEYPPGTPLTPTTNPINGKPWANITEYSAFMGNGSSTNISGGYMNITILNQVQAGWDRYWPDRLNLEANAINDWTNCPYVTYDFNEYYSAIDLPIISFTSELFGLPRGNGAVANFTNFDTTRTVLRGYGHLDVYCGVYSVRDVSEPVYQWMINHLPPQLITTVTQTATTIQIGYAASFYAIVSGGAPPFTYQWYQGLTPVGNNPQLTQYPNTAGVYTYKCKITDVNGATTISNPLTLSVATFAVTDPTKSAQPTQTPTAKPTNSPTPTLSPSPTSSLSPSPTPDNEALSLSTNAIYALTLIVVIISVIAVIVIVVRKKAK